MKKIAILVLMICNVCQGTFVYDDLKLIGDEKEVFWYNGANWWSIAAHPSMVADFNQVWPASEVGEGTPLIDVGSGIFAWGSPLFVDTANGRVGIGAFPLSTETKTQVGTEDLSLAGSSLIGHWKLNENAANTTVVDSSDTANNGTAEVDTNQLNAVGITNSAFDLDGSTEFVTVPDNAAYDFATTFTIGFWAQPDVLTANKYVLTRGFSDENEIGYFIQIASSGKWFFSIFITDSGTGVFSDSAATTSDWQFVIGTRDAEGLMKLYVDAIVQTGRAVFPGSLDNDVPLFIGTHSGAGANVFDGKIDNVMMFNIALEQAGVDAFYDPSNTALKPMLHISKADSPSGSVREMVRTERTGDDDSGESGIGLSETFYLENQSVAVQAGAFIWEFPTVSSNPDPSRFSLLCHTGDGGLKRLMRQQDEWLGFLDTSSGFYMNLAPAVTGADKVLSINMGGENRTITWSGAPSGAPINVEAETRLDQDYTDDANVVFNDLTLSTPSNIYALSHDNFADFEPNEHLDWTGETANILTTGTVKSESIDVNDGAVGTPTFSFISDTDTGFYTEDDAGNQLINIAIDGVHNHQFGSEFFAIKDTLSANLGKIIFGNTAMTAERIFTLDLDNGGRTLKMSGNLTVEATSVINSDLSTDATWQTSSSITGGSFVTGGDIGISGDTDILQLSANTLTVNNTISSTTITASGLLTGGSIVTGGLIGLAIDPDLLSLTSNLLTVNGGITATGNIIIADAGNIGSATTPGAVQIEADGDIVLSNNLYIPASLIHVGDADTSIAFGTDNMIFTAGNLEMMRFTESFVDSISFNINNENIDLRVDGDAVDDVFRVDASADTVNLKTTTIGDGGASTYLTVDGSGNTWWIGAGTGLPYGHMYVDGTQSIIVALTLNTPTEIEDDGTTSAEDGWLAGDLNLITFPTGGTEHYITVTKAGVYSINWNISFKMVTGAANTQIHMGLAVDGTAIRDKCEAHRTISNNIDTGNAAGSCLVDLPNGNEELSIWMENTTNSNDAEVVHGSLVAVQVGGT